MGTPHCLLTLDAFQYYFGWNTWRNPNLLSFDVFEENSRFIVSDEILQERSLLVSQQHIGENSDTFGFVVDGEFVGDPPSQFPYVSELFETIYDGRMVHIEIFGQQL